MGDELDSSAGVATQHGRFATLACDCDRRGRFWRQGALQVLDRVPAGKAQECRWGAIVVLAEAQGVFRPEQGLQPGEERPRVTEDDFGITRRVRPGWKQARNVRVSDRLAKNGVDEAGGAGEGWLAEPPRLGDGLGDDGVIRHAVEETELIKGDQ